MNDENFDSEQFIRDFSKIEKDFETEIDFMKNVSQNNNIMTTKEDSDNKKNDSEDKESFNQEDIELNENFINFVHKINKFIQFPILKHQYLKLKYLYYEINKKNIEIKYEDYCRSDIIFCNIKHKVIEFIIEIIKHIINILILENKIPKHCKIRKINVQIMKDDSKIFNEIFFNSNIEKILSNNINNKYSKGKEKKHKEQYNNVNNIKKLKDKNGNFITNQLENIFKSDFHYFYNLYIYDNVNEIKEKFGIKNIKFLKDFLNDEKFKKKHSENVELIKLKYKMIAFGEYSLHKDSRLVKEKFEKKIKKFKNTSFYLDLIKEYEKKFGVYIEK